MENLTDPKDIYQSILEILSETTFNNDFDGYHSQFHLPYLLQTANGVLLLNDEADLRQAFDAAQKRFTSLLLNGMIRVCSAAIFTDGDTIEGTHRTWLTQDQTQIRQSYAGAMTLRRTDGVWRVAANRYSDNAALLPEDIRTMMERAAARQRDAGQT